MIGPKKDFWNHDNYWTWLDKYEQEIQELQQTEQQQLDEEYAQQVEELNNDDTGQ